jgi:hypothetical protein
MGRRPGCYRRRVGFVGELLDRDSRRDGLPTIFQRFGGDPAWSVSRSFAGGGVAAIEGLLRYLADVAVDAQPFEPVIRGMLLTGEAPLHTTARLIGSGSSEPEVSDEPRWPSGAKVSAEDLNDYLGNH